MQSPLQRLIGFGLLPSDRRAEQPPVAVSNVQIASKGICGRRQFVTVLVEECEPMECAGADRYDGTSDGYRGNGATTVERAVADGLNRIGDDGFRK